MPAEPPLVSFIIPTYNGESTIQDTIESLIAQNYPRTEIIIINDGSTDETHEILATYANEITIIHLEENMGHSVAANTGIKYSSGDLLGLMDDDIEISEDWTQRLVDKMYSLPDDVVLLQPKIIEDDKASKTTEGDTQTIQTCGVLAVSDAIKDVDGFDERYFAWVNDMELAANLINHNYRVYCYPEVEVIHKSNSWSGGSLSPLKTYYYTRNYAWYYWKHYDRCSALFHTLKHFIQTGYRALREDTLISFIKGALVSITAFRYYYIHTHHTENKLNYETSPVQILKEAVT